MGDKRLRHPGPFDLATSGDGITASFPCVPHAQETSMLMICTKINLHCLGVLGNKRLLFRSLFPMLPVRS